VTCTGKRRGSYRVLVGKPERKITLGRPRHRWEGIITMKIQEIGSGEWIGLLWLMTGGSSGLL
jgi:hypothetical protein